MPFANTGSNEREMVMTDAFRTQQRIKAVGVAHAILEGKIDFRAGGRELLELQRDIGVSRLPESGFPPEAELGDEDAGDGLPEDAFKDENAREQFRLYAAKHDEGLRKVTLMACEAFILKYA